MTQAIRYAAFISYASKDARFARALHRALEAYGIPAALGRFELAPGAGKPNRIYPVFRDREELSAGDLAQRIQEGLEASGALIVVCSPNAAASPWVDKEIRHFIALGRRDRIFAIIADSAPLYDASGADATQSCFPPAFRGDSLSDPGALEPLAADARKGKDGFRTAWLKVIAGLIGVTPGQLVDRDRARRRGAWMRAAALWLILLGGVGAAYANRARIEPIVGQFVRFTMHKKTDAALALLAPGAVFQECATGSNDCPAMVVLPAGAFTMSEPPQDANDPPQTHETVARFAVSRTEITFNQWAACAALGGCSSAPTPDDESWGRGDRPVVNVSWNDAQEYVAWLSRMTGADYRLLSSVEWEYAARAVTSADAPQTKWSHGDDEQALRDYAWVEDYGDIGSQPVAQKKPNAFGLYDMHGNVWEWVGDCGRPYNSPQRWPGPDCPMREIRGGSWAGHPHYARSASSESGEANVRQNDYGFRVARTLR